jgi:hypothetical protein
MLEFFFEPGLEGILFTNETTNIAAAVGNLSSLHPVYTMQHDLGRYRSSTGDCNMTQHPCLVFWVVLTKPARVPPVPLFQPVSD